MIERNQGKFDKMMRMWPYTNLNSENKEVMHTVHTIDDQIEKMSLENQ